MPLLRRLLSELGTPRGGVLLLRPEELLSETGMFGVGEDVPLLAVAALPRKEVALDGLLLLAALPVADLADLVPQFLTVLLADSLGTVVAAAFDDVGVDGLDLAPALSEEGLEVLELLGSEVAADHLDLAQSDL
jgi:hypothetical protein